MMRASDDWVQRGRIEAPNSFYAIAEHLLAAGGTLRDVMSAVDTELTLASEQRTSPVRASPNRPELRTLLATLGGHAAEI